MAILNIDRFNRTVVTTGMCGIQGYHSHIIVYIPVQMCMHVITIFIVILIDIRTLFYGFHFNQALQGFQEHLMNKKRKGPHTLLIHHALLMALTLDLLAVYVCFEWR